MVKARTHICIWCVWLRPGLWTPKVGHFWLPWQPVNEIQSQLCKNCYLESPSPGFPCSSWRHLPGGVPDRAPLEAEALVRTGRTELRKGNTLVQFKFSASGEIIFASHGRRRPAQSSCPRRLRCPGKFEQTLRLKCLVTRRETVTLFQRGIIESGLSGSKRIGRCTAMTSTMTFQSWKRMRSKAETIPSSPGER